MADRETSVRYKALADFAALNRNLRTTKRNMEALRKEEERLNATTVAGENASAAATGRHAKSRDELVQSINKETSAVQRSTKEFVTNAREARKRVKFTEDAAKAQETLTKATDTGQYATRRARIEAERLAATGGKVEQMTRRQRREIERMQESMTRANKGVSKFQQGLLKLQNWRPRLTPPFIVLIPAIAGVLGLINPLVAGLGALGIAAFALASSLGSVVSVLATGIVPALATTIGLVAALKTAFGGIGEAFKAASAMRDVTGGGGGGAKKEEISDAEKLARAQEALARATQDVAWAQEDLDEARKGYIERLKALQKAVDRAAMSEARAAANAQLARENYANVLADPGSTKGQKMDAQVGVDEAAADYSDVIEENKKNQAALLEMQQKGIEGDREVIMATRALTDAINRQRDAEIDLINEQNGANKAAGAGASAAAKYRAALDKLSPSARKFVEHLVGMQDAWENVQRSVQERFFGEVADDLDRIDSYLPSIDKMLGSIAGAAGRVFSRFLKLTTSADWLKDIEDFGEEAAPVIEDVGSGLLSWLDAFRNLTMAALPFLQDLAAGFKDSAEEFSVFISEGRKSGSIAEWLDSGRKRLEQWWRVIKNIGATLYNYGVAAAPFADWLTTGLEESTERWRKNSEAAREAGSPFQDYLERIKPLLQEVKGLIGDFFSWFSREAMDQDNIEQMVEIFQTLREDVGPALSKAFDALGDAKIGPKIVETLGKLIEFVATVLDNGGADTLARFFDILGGILDALTEFAASPGGGAIITTLGTVLAGLAALSFVGQFTGLTNLLGLLLQFAGKEGVIKALGGLGNIGKGAGGLAARGLAGLGGGSALGGAGIGAAIVAGAASVGQTTTSIVDLIGGLNNGSLLDGASYSAKEGAQYSDETNRRMGSGMIYSTLPIIGAIQTGLDAFFPELGAEFRNFIEDIGAGLNQWITTLFTRDIPQWWNGLIGWLTKTWSDAVAAVRTWWSGVVNNVSSWWNGAIANVSNWWNGVINGVSSWWNNLINVTIPGYWSGFVTWLQGLWQGAVDTIGGFFSPMINGIISLLNLIPGVNIAPVGAKKGTKRASGGEIPGTGNTDTVPAMLTPGEVVLKKSVVNRMGPDVADAFGRGLISFTDAFRLAHSAPAKSKRGSGFGGGIQFFAGGGIVPDPFDPGNSPAGGGLPPSAFGGSPGSGTTMNFGDIIINNPTAEPASDSLPRTIRKVSYLGSGR